MNKTTKALIWIVVAIVVLLGGFYIYKATVTNPTPITQEKKIIKIGYVAPASGETVAYGDYVTKAFKLGIEDFNSTHPNLQFEVVYEDGKCDGKTAATAINKLISIDGVKYVVGGFCSGETLAMAPIAESNKVLMLSAGSSSPDITNAGDYIFRNLASDDYTAKVTANIAINNNDKEIALIYEKTEYGQALVNTFKKYYVSNGGTIKLDEAFNANTTDFKTIITKAKTEDIKSVYIVVQSYKESALIFKQMKELDYAPKIYSSEGAISNEALKYYDSGYKSLLEGAVFTQPKFDETNSNAAKMLAEYKTKYGSTEGPLPMVYLATSYDAVSLLGEAIQEAGDSTDKVKNYFYKLKNWQGAVGNFSFDQNGDAVTDVEAKVVKDGQIIPMQ